MADAGRVQIAYIEESAFGTTPGSALTKIANATSESLGGSTTTTMTEALRGDYVKPQVIRTDVSGGGDIGFELAYEDLDAFFEGALRTDVAADVTSSGTFNSVAATSKYTRASGSFVSDGWVVGMSGKAAGFGSTSDGVFVVTAVSALEMTVTGIVLADVTGDADESLSNDGFFKNGTTLKSYTLERQFADLTTKFIPHKGQRVSGLSLSAQAGQIVTGSVSFEGKFPSAVASATAGSGSYSASPGVSNEIMNGVDHVTGIFVGSAGAPGTAAVTYCVSQIDLNIGSPVRPISCLGSIGPVAVGGNSFEITGTISVYADDTSMALWTDYVNYTAKSLWFRFVDTAGNTMAVYLPQVQFTAMDGPNATGPDSDVAMSATFTAELHTASGMLIGITKIDA